MVSADHGFTTIRDWDQSSDWFGFNYGDVCSGCGSASGGDFIIATGLDESIRLIVVELKREIEEACIMYWCNNVS